jgi:hypothetical protein
MDKTGTLTIEDGESRVDGTLLGRNVASGQDPYGAATDYVTDHNCHDGDCVTVSGSYQGKVLYTDSVQKLNAGECEPGAAENLMIAKRIFAAPVTAKARSAAPKKAAKKASITAKLSGPTKATKKAAKKSVVKKSVVKKQTAKAASAKASSSKKAAKKKTEGR